MVITKAMTLPGEDDARGAEEGGGPRAKNGLLTHERDKGRLYRKEELKGDTKRCPIRDGCIGAEEGGGQSAMIGLLTHGKGQRSMYRKEELKGDTKRCLSNEGKRVRRKERTNT